MVASDIFVYLAAIVQEAVVADRDMFGAVFDLVKAFNLLPWTPIL